MTTRLALLATSLCFGATLSLLAAPHALAQAAPGQTSTGSTSAPAEPMSEPAPISPLSSPQNQPTPPADDADKKAAPPAALPGAAGGIGAAPATQAAKDMDPNTALFDAVNRGDIQAAKEALNRGADLDATNPLGQTPIDMSIDLDRNAITFLLLSMRQGGESTGAPAEAYAADNAPAKGHKKGKHAHPAPATDSDVAAATPKHGRAVPARVVNVAAETGTPQPQAGFYGFGR